MNHFSFRRHHFKRCKAKMARHYSAGSHKVAFNRESFPAGIYFLQLKTNEGMMMKKLALE
jgi:hypothetical protein